MVKKSVPKKKKELLLKQKGDSFVLEEKKKEKIKGIGGWLLIPTIGLILGAIGFPIAVIFYLYLIFSQGLAFWGWYSFISILIGGSLIIYCLILEFKHKKEFPKWLIITFWLSFVLGTVLYLLEKDYFGLLASAVWPGIWTWYLLVSKRVKNTFVE